MSASSVLYLRDQAVVTPRQLSEILVSLFQELQNRFGKVIAARHHALHVVLLVLDGAKQHRIGEIDHRRHAPALRAKQNALALGRTIDDVIRRAQIFPEQLGFVLVEGAFEVRCEKPVLHVHAGSQAEFGHAAQNKRLVGHLLGVLAEQNDPSGVERSVNVIVPAVDVQRMLGERPSGHLHYHRGALARRVIILLDSVDDSLARRKIDDPAAADRMRNGAALRRVLAFGFDRDGAVAEDIQLSFRKGLLIKLAPFGGRRDRIENPGIRDACFRVIRNQLISVGGHSNTGIAWFFLHGMFSLDDCATAGSRNFRLLGWFPPCP